MKQCKKCSQPMQQSDDFAEGNFTSEICEHCADDIASGKTKDSKVGKKIQKMMRERLIRGGKTKKQAEQLIKKWEKKHN